MGLDKLKMAMFVTFVLLFGTLLGLTGLLVWFVGPSLSLSANLGFILALTIFFGLVQWYLGPWMIRKFTGCRELKEGEYAWLKKMLNELAHKAGIPQPQLYLVYNPTPNAFAFGRTQASSAIGVHTGLIENLSEDEVKAVLAHEVGHIKNKDVLLITVASMIPTLIYYLVILLGSSARNRDERNSPFSMIMVYLGAYVAQFFTYLLVLYLSRVREFYADRYSASLTNKPRDMITALARISYGFTPPRGAETNQNMRAFYIAEPSGEIASAIDTAQLERDLQKAGEKKAGEGKKIEAGELGKAIAFEKTRGFFEVFSTHPLTYRRLEALEKVDMDLRMGRKVV